MLHSFNRAQPCNSLTELPPVPAILPVGAILKCELNGETIIAVGTAPSGLVALLSPRSWDLLQDFELDRLLLTDEGVRAFGPAAEAWPLVARFITAASPSQTVCYRNDDPSDLRWSNLEVLEHNLVPRAMRQLNEEAHDLHLRHARKRPSKRKAELSVDRGLQDILSQL
jgi:hypothetical protein